MVEYLYDCIRATAGEDIGLTAIIENDNGEPITEHCHVMLFDKDNTLIYTGNGLYIDDLNEWQFTIPGEITKEKTGRYWYRICSSVQSLCFKQPIYFIV